MFRSPKLASLHMLLELTLMFLSVLLVCVVRAIFLLFLWIILIAVKMFLVF